MPQPVFTRNIKVINHAASTSVTSANVDVSDANYLGMQVTWNGTSVDGTLDLECSLDGVNFGVVDTVTINSNSGTSVLNTLMVAPFVRAKFTYVSGTVVSLVAYICTKQSG
jgi:hypothetical protein